MQSEPWAPYVPDAQMPWTLERAVHLHRRAAFGATWEELQRDLKDGPAASVERLLAGTAALRTEAEFSTTAALLADAAASTGEIKRLKACWFFRMLLGPDPLGEKLTLLWHDHFATANSKVRDVGLMRQQNEVLRRHARGRFADLLNASVREPALLVYLDAPANRNGHPNENLARELMELFTIGVGHFSEVDVKEAARALTGWTVNDRAFKSEAERHDGGEKTILGKPGKWTGDDLVKTLIELPATAERIVTKLCRQFFGEPSPPASAKQALATDLREHDLDIGWAVGTILKSKLFFADANLHSRVLSPVEFIVGAARALELIDPPPSTLAMADWSARMGQDLFDPPNVGGWPGGSTWMSARGLIARANYAAALVNGPNAGRTTPYEPGALAAKYGFGTDAAAVLRFHHQLLFGIEPAMELRENVPGADGGQIVSRLLASPEAQLG